MDYTHSSVLLQCTELNYGQCVMYGIMKNLELSYNMNLMHIKSSLYVFHYPHKANIKDFGTKLVERTQYSYFLLWC
jgi:hypothetical protein